MQGERLDPIGSRGLDEQMIMIGHEAVSVANPVVSLIDVLEGVQKVLAVGIVLEDGFLFVAARCHMIYSAGVLYTEGTSHGAT